MGLTIGGRMENRIDIHKILQILPHRYPFILVDRILDIVPGERITALKNVTINEPFFQGHFPGIPIMPGVLIVEAMAQAGGNIDGRICGTGFHGRVDLFYGHR